MRAFMTIISFCSSPTLNKMCYHKKPNERGQININYCLQILVRNKKYQDDTKKKTGTTFDNT